MEVEQVNLESGVVVLAISGSLTMGTQLQRLEWLMEELAEKGHGRIVVDAAKLAYIDSAGIGVLLKGAALAKQAGGKMLLAEANERVVSTLKLLGLESVISQSPTRDEAVRSF